MGEHTYRECRISSLAQSSHSSSLALFALLIAALSSSVMQAQPSTLSLNSSSHFSSFSICFFVFFGGGALGSGGGGVRRFGCRGAIRERAERDDFR